MIDKSSKVSIEDIIIEKAETISKILEKGNRIELILVKDGVKVLSIDRREV